MASSSSVDMIELTELSAEELLISKPNLRILKVEAYVSGNKLGRPFLTFAVTDKLKLDKSIPVVLRNGVWHNLIIKDKRGYAHQPYPSMHNYDHPEHTRQKSQDFETVELLMEKRKKESNDSDSEDDERKRVDQGICHSPTLTRQFTQNINYPESLVKEMSATQTTQATLLQTTEQLAQAIQGAGGKKRKGLPSGGGPPPAGGSGGGGGPPPAGGSRGSGGPPSAGGGGALNPPAGGQGAAPAQPNPNVKVMGTKPENFEGDRMKAKEFMEDVKKYMRLNRQVPGFSSPMTKVAMVLTFMKGQATSGWTRAIGDWIDTLDPAIDDQPVVWETFLIAFEQQYVDSQKENRARNKLENLRMKFPEIDEYIATFEDTSRNAGYTMTNPENMQFFLKGLSRGVLADVLRAPIPRTYQEMKTKAIECTNAQQTMSNIMTSLTGGKPFRPFQTNRPQTNQGSQGSWRRQQQQQQQQRQSWGGRPHFNSSNAPPSMNNQPVPMDLGRSRNPNYRGRG